MPHILEDLKHFLDNSPTSYHAIRQIANRLALCEYLPLQEKEEWKLEKGKRYFVCRGGALCTFSIPSSMPDKMIILGSHTDSPALKLKPQPEHHKENMRLLGVEVYGGPLLNAWLNRDLSIAGRVIVSDTTGQRVERLVWLDDAPLVIPQLAIHLDREVNDKGLKLNKQEHLIPLAGLIKEHDQTASYLETLLHRHIQFKTLLGSDLFLVPLEPSRFLGAEGELIASYRLDNLASAHACTTAMGMLQTPSENVLQVAAFWDHEEIGSRTMEGAASTLLQDTIKRILCSLNIKDELYLRLKSQSLIISIDVAHGFHPGFEKKYDLQHLPLLGQGVVIKFNADHKYTTNGPTAAILTQALESLNLHKQLYTARNDVGCGSTIGPIAETQMGIPSVDIGIPVLSMHSIREIIAGRDHLDMCTLLHHILTANKSL
ncbi:MAG: M18 family aminopeptidase [Simkania sp.]|nr:M18 family aminopeptidase [Simkania sp.]